MTGRRSGSSVLRFFGSLLFGLYSWYLAQICTELDLSLAEVAEANLVKLFARLERGMIQGSGDER